MKKIFISIILINLVYISLFELTGFKLIDSLFYVPFIMLLVSSLAYLYKNWREKTKTDLVLKIIGIIILGVSIMSFFLFSNTINDFEKVEQEKFYLEINNHRYNITLTYPYGVWSGENGLLEIEFVYKPIPLFEKTIFIGRPPESLFENDLYGGMVTEQNEQKRIIMEYIKKEIIIEN
jgi:amino acid transporter